MKTVSSQIASRSELLELVETLGMYAHIEQPKSRQLRSISSSEEAGHFNQLFPLQQKKSIGFRTLATS